MTNQSSYDFLNISKLLTEDIEKEKFRVFLDEYSIKLYTCILILNQNKKYEIIKIENLFNRFGIKYIDISNGLLTDEDQNWLDEKLHNNELYPQDYIFVKNRKQEIKNITIVKLLKTIIIIDSDE